MPAAAVAAIAACLALVCLAPAASAHVDAPNVSALHAFVGDPLLGLDKPEGTLLGIKPDEQTAMGSTKKVWLLDLAAHALADGAVDLGDKLTITKFEADIGGSAMKDVNGTPLEAGEVVKFGDLIRGMMYPSGNNATYAVARHVAQGYFGPAADWKSAVTMMNDHAAALGQTDTHLDFTPYHDDDLTTARELSEEFQHALQDPFFAQVVGFTGTYTATTQGPNGPKTYSWNWGRNYPGWEGEKGGQSTPCNGPNQGPNPGCGVVAATRVGRRVVVSAMQQGGNDLNTMLDHGFASIFHPDPRGTSGPLWTEVDRHDVTCLEDGRAVSAVLPPSGPVSLALWKTDVDGSYVSKLADASLPGSGNGPTRGGLGASGDVAVTHLPSGDLIVATRKGAGVELSRWTINRAGGLTLLASGIKAGLAATMRLQPVSGDTFLTAMIEPYPSRALVLKSWRLEGSGLVQLDTYTDDSRSYTEVATARTLTTDVLNRHQVVTVTLEPGGVPLIHRTWNVDQATGAISLLNGIPEYGAWGSNVTITPLRVNTVFEGELFPPAYYATAYRNSSGMLTIRFYRIDGTGKPVFANGIDTKTPVERVELEPLGTGGVMSASRDLQGYVQLVAWDVARKANDLVDVASISQHYAPGAASLDLCRLPSTHAEGDYVTATKDLDGLFRLRAYRSGDRP